MQFSYSRVGIFNQCKQRFKYSYIDKIKAIPEGNADDALVVGNCMHLGIETGVQNMIKTYYNSFNVIDDKQVNEAIKLEFLCEKVKSILDKINIKYQEYMIDTPEFKGIVDLIVENEDGTVDVFDFKYSNNVDRYMDSGQLHIYKYFLEQQGFIVKNLGFIFIPKTLIKQKKTETLYQFRKRLLKTLDQLKVKIVGVKYDESKVTEFLKQCDEIINCDSYPPNITKLCDWCEFKQYCKDGVDYMILPKNEKRKIENNSNIKIWIYGAPFVGKSYLANQFPDALFLNTDGNVKFIDSPFVAIKDDIKIEGRIKNKIFAWDTFKDAIDEILMGQHDFKTIVVDLLDDTYEAARLHVYDKLGVEHEHDAGFGKGYDMVKTEFLPQIRRLTNSNYNIILISHEVTSEFIRKNGDKMTTISTPLPTKTANKIAGMVDAVIRITNDSGVRYINFKNNNTVFGGGRLDFNVDKIKCSYEELKKLYSTPEGVTNDVLHEPSSNDTSTTSDESTGKKRTKRTRE